MPGTSGVGGAAPGPGFDGPVGSRCATCEPAGRTQSRSDAGYGEADMPASVGDNALRVPGKPAP